MGRLEESGVEIEVPFAEPADAHEAVARWWAAAVLLPIFDNAENDEHARLQASTEIHARAFLWGVVDRISEFTRTLADISRERQIGRISTDYRPDETLVEAAEQAGMTISPEATFPWKSATWHVDDGTVLAAMGEHGEPEQIWPPVVNPTTE